MPGLGFRHHAVEIATGQGSEMRREAQRQKVARYYLLAAILPGISWLSANLLSSVALAQEPAKVVA
jgi:hypothetical protein